MERERESGESVKVEDFLKGAPGPGFRLLLSPRALDARVGTMHYSVVVVKLQQQPMHS